MGKKTLIISEEQIKKVRQGLIAYENVEPDYEIGFEEPVDMSSYAHVVNEKTTSLFKSVLNEENRTQKRKCVEYITKCIHPYIRQYIDLPLNNIPHALKQGLRPESGLFKVVANNQTGCNKFIDYLRLNLYSHFGIKRDSILVNFIPGIARIACEELNFYAMDNTIKGGKITVFSNFLTLLKNKPEYILQDVELSPDFNGMNFDELIELFKEKIQTHKQEMDGMLDAESQNLTPNSYQIFPISDVLVPNHFGYGYQLKLTDEGRRTLRKLEPYCDWCICEEGAGDYEYEQYLNNGGKIYVCLKDGFEKIERVEGENCPLDEYGLSMLCIIIGKDGMPTNVTTRWNHENSGENHNDLWNAPQLQKLLGVNFKETFKPRPMDEINKICLSEGKIMTEETNPEDVDLSSFEIKNELNPKFWKNNKIDSRIRLKLLDIADDFIDFLNVKWAQPEDIVMTGSLANFTWSEEYSDIDLHILYKFSDVDERTDFVEGYFDGKKTEWNDKHENLKIFGFPVEVYVQDVDETHTASGVYSLEKNEWVKEPDKDNFNENDYEDKIVKKKVSDYMNQIDDLEEKLEKSDTESDIETIYDKSITLYDKIKNERNNGLREKEQKELSNGNLIFKSLRRNGYIEKLMNLRNNSYDKCNSLS